MTHAWKPGSSFNFASLRGECRTELWRSLAVDCEALVVRVDVVPGAYRHIQVWFALPNVESVKTVCRVEKEKQVMGHDVWEIPVISPYCSREECLLIDFETARLASSREDACVAVTMYV
jgi:hypothetical protein